ncbi:hypothetical protein Glove_109g81 [Diversispora epigaea]|uniref:Uncharacterized protein n=1 Tax=Diversispora epigaea TaxID=1348612 RepID=A0A397JD04_9GLOM|nr:hypothetical protein Glove_109g81 [Diversispora epigaea]
MSASTSEQTIIAEVSRLFFFQNENKLTEGERVSLFSYFTKNKERIVFVLLILNTLNDDNSKLEYLRTLIPKPELLNEQELFRVVIPIPELLPIKTKTTTHSATRKVPNIPVLKWDTFLVNAFNASTTLDTSDRIFSIPDIDGALSAEDSAVDMFLNAMVAINNKRLILFKRPESWGKRYMFQGVKGRPDAIRCSADNKNLLKNSKASQLLSIVEVKPEQLMRNLIEHGAELFEAYNTALTVDDNGTAEYTRHRKIIKIVRQVFGSMVVNDLRYGLLTTYIRTWFFYRQREDPDIIYISPTVYINQSHTDNYASFSESIRYFENISTVDPIAHSTPNTKESDDDFDFGGGGGKYKKSGDDDDGDDDEPSGSKKKSPIERAFMEICNILKKGKGKVVSDDELLKNMKNYKRNQISFGDLLEVVDPVLFLQPSFMKK